MDQIIEAEEVVRQGDPLVDAVEEGPVDAVEEEAVDRKPEEQKDLKVE